MILLLMKILETSTFSSKSHSYTTNHDLLDQAGHFDVMYLVLHSVHCTQDEGRFHDAGAVIHHQQCAPLRYLNRCPVRQELGVAAKVS